jgi:hypothetical protein
MGGRKRPWLNLRYYPGTSTDKFWKIRKSLNQDSQFPSWDLKLGYPKVKQEL